MDFVPALVGLKTSLELAKLAIEARDDIKAKQAISDMARLLSDANLGALAASEKALFLAGQLADLRDELAELKRRAAEREQYALHEIADGRFVYQSRAIAEDAEKRSVPAHYLCQLCFDDGRKSILRKADVWGSVVWNCAVNDVHSITI